MIAAVLGIDRDDLDGALDWFLERPVRVLATLAVAWVAARVARWLIRRWVPRIYVPREPAVDRLKKLGIDVSEPRRKARGATITSALASAASLAIWTVAALTALDTAGLNIGPLLAGAGVAGVALGFGAQSIVRDGLAGLFMLIEDQYGIGDAVDLGLPGDTAQGVVEEIHLRTTVVRGLDGTVWHVPNGVIQRVGNKSQLWSVAVLDASVAYQTDLTLARELLHRAADEVCTSDRFRDSVLEPPAVLGVESVAAEGITLRMTVKVEPGTQWALQRALREHVKEVFETGGIQAPPPSRTVWTRLGGTPEPSDGAT